MAQPKSPLLPPITDEIAAANPARVRKRKKGGWQWECDYIKSNGKKCKALASSTNKKDGELRCYSHSGTTFAQVAPELRAEKEAKVIKVGNAPGRPRSSWYGRDTVNVDNLINEWREQGIDPDQTEEDLLRLRAYLEEWTSTRNEIKEIRELLEPMLDALNDFDRWMVDVEPDKAPIPMQDLLEATHEFRPMQRLVLDLLRLYTATLSQQQMLEFSHDRIIKLVKIRAETRLKDEQAKQIKVFNALFGQLMVILREALPADVVQLIMARCERDLKEAVPAYIFNRRVLPNGELS